MKSVLLEISEGLEEYAEFNANIERAERLASLASARVPFLHCGDPRCSCCNAEFKALLEESAEESAEILELSWDNKDYLNLVRRGSS